MHSLYLSHLGEIADVSHQAIAFSFTLSNTQLSVIGILTFQVPIPMLLPTQLPFLVQLVHQLQLSFLAVFQLPKAKLAGREIKLHENLTYGLRM